MNQLAILIAVLFVVNGHPAAFDPNAIVGVWHAQDGHDYLALKAGVTIKLDEPSDNASLRWLGAVGGSTAIRVDAPCGKGR